MRRLEALGAGLGLDDCYTLLEMLMEGRPPPEKRHVSPPRRHGGGGRLWKAVKDVGRRVHELARRQVTAVCEGNSELFR